MKHTFQIVTQNSGKEDMAAILVVLSGIKAGKLKNDLKLLNFYHEIPFSYAAKIDHVDADAIELSVHQAQAAVLGLQKQTLLKSSHFPHGLGVHCYVEHINVRSCLAVLGRFAYATVRAERREAVRVTVESRADALYQADGQEISGRVRDISVTGTAIESTSPAPVGIADQGVIDLHLPGYRFTCSAGYIRSISVEQGYQHIFSLQLDTQQEEQVSQFIYARQVEIIRDLKDQQV